MARDNDDAVQLLKGIGELYRRNGQSQRALVMLLIAVNVAPNDGMLLRSLVLAFTDSGDPARALGALDRLVVLEGESASLMLLRARALWYGERKDEARQCFKRYLAARRAGA
ncbi:tetratricopeptide repeat protein [Pseudomonas azotoformans]|uniref:tetratricopeptide repeat protein n=1 Tax=Pseudomonas azotoformans TaxID=47878 RepID=UPI00098FC0F5|nr:type III secretion protein [Pseudomonas azotoformans]